MKSQSQPKDGRPRVKIVIRTPFQPDREVTARMGYNSAVQLPTIRFDALGLSRPADDFPKQLEIRQGEQVQVYDLREVCGPAYCAWGEYKTAQGDAVLVIA